MISYIYEKRKRIINISEKTKTAKGLLFEGKYRKLKMYNIFD